MDEQAIEALRGRCAAQPGRAEPRIALARALLDARRAAEAVIPAEQALALAPHLSAAAAVREAVMAAVLAGDPDLVKLELAAALDPGAADAQLALGEAYASLERPHDAERCFKRALALGRTADAHADLASLYLSVGMADAAEHHALAVLDGPDRGTGDDLIFAMAHQTLAGVAAARGDAAASEARLDQAYGRQNVFRQLVSGCAFTTLVLVSRRAGNIPYQALLPPLRCDLIVWYMEHASIGQLAGLAPHAVVLNAIGDADVATASRPVVDAVVAACGQPVLNRPERVRATFRHRLAETFAGVANLVIPRTERLEVGDVAGHGLAGAVARIGLATPVLVRPTASHGGQGLVLARDEAELAGLPKPDGAVYVSQFHPYASADGYHRKYRVIFVDRRPYPYHLAISRHWMAHHQTSDMAGDAARTAEELAFLRDPAGAIGARAMAAIAAIGERLDLDYGGVDFAVTADGEVLLFEANATMLAHLEPDDGPFAAKNPYVRRIIEAFQARLAALADGSV